MPDLGVATDEEIFRELRGRGWGVVADPGSVIRRKSVKVMTAPERNTVPEDRWLDVFQCIQNADHLTDPVRRINQLSEAVLGLYLLFEPASVRNRRGVPNA